MKASILRLLLQSHADGDEASFRKAALQLAAAESNAGHVRVADEIRTIVAKMPATGNRASGSIVDIATPRGEFADLLEGGHRDERFRDIILRSEVRDLLRRVLSENRSRGRLERFGISPRRRLLFHGAPGCGKTLAAAVLAGEMGLPLMTVRFDALFSRFLGATAVQLRAIFAEMPRRPGVYLFDEFDSVAKARGDSQDVGEMNRVVTAFLQLVDADVSGSILVAATNHVELLDRAMFRRFDVIVPFEKPNRDQLVELLELRLGTLGLTRRQAEDLAGQAEGWSFADVARACDDAVRTMALDDRDEISQEDIARALEELKQRELSTEV
ncbi:MAG: ATP-binding protein [bacterium]|nr:ATP-binding protein [bacterium]